MNKKCHELYLEFYFLFYECFIIAKDTLNGICNGRHSIGILAENCLTDRVFGYQFLQFLVIIMHIVFPETHSLVVNRTILTGYYSNLK